MIVPSFCRTINIDLAEEITIMSKKTRIEIRMPIVILEMVDQYKEDNGIPTRTAAILELIRLGYDLKNKNN